jgi:hypothetical protein
MEIGSLTIIIWISFGVVGLALGRILDKLGAGFILGLLLGPIGWIILFLLPRDAQTQVANADSTPTSSRPERDLDSDAYKVWLGKQYNITKNDLFDKYECDEVLFATLDEALIYADQKEREMNEGNAVEGISLSEEEQQLEEQRRRDEQKKSSVQFLTFIVVATALTIVIGIFSNS